MSLESEEQKRTAPSILIVDDHEAVRVTLEHILRRSGYNVLSADTGACAAMLASTEPIDGALIDVHMPGMTGFECLRIIQQNRPAGRGAVRVWFMTGAPTPEIARTAQQVGAMGVLNKPFELLELITTLKQGLALPAPAVPSQIGEESH